MKLRLHLLLAASWVFRVSLVAWVCVVSRTFLCHKGFPGEGPVLLDPLLLVQQQVDQKILELNLSETSADSTFQRLGDWAIDSLSDRAATARVQDRPEVWQALLGDTFPSRVASHGLSFHVERQPYQVHRPRQLPMPAEPAAEVSRQVASHLQRGYIEVVPTESDDHLPLPPDAPAWERSVPVAVSKELRPTADGKELARRLRQTAAHARAGRTHLSLPRRGQTPTRAAEATQRLFTQPAAEPQVLRGARGYVHKVHLDYESQLFVVPKRKQGEWRMCQNLKFWNVDFSTKQHFKLEGASALAAMLRPGDWACTGDLSQAYHQCGVHPQFRRQLRFRWNGVRYQWRVLPFGLRLAPLYWTKLLRPVVAKARAAGIRCLLYLDDLVVVAESKAQAARDWAVLAALMARQLGLLFAPAKTNVVPVQVFEALGFEWDCQPAVSPLCRLPLRKVKALARMAKRMANMFEHARPVSCRLVARYLGLLESVKLACPWIRRAKGALSWCLRGALRLSGWEGQVRPKPQVIADLRFVYDRLPVQCESQLQRPPPSVVVSFGADAARTLQWGAWAKRPAVQLPSGHSLPAVDVETFGPFTASEYASSINVLEGIGQRQGLAALLPQVVKGLPPETLSQVAVECVCDNTTTLHSNNKQRARGSFLQLVQANQIWDLLLRSGLDPLRWSTTHLAGVLNVRADRLSRRRFDPRAWSLAPWVFQLLQRKLGRYCCVDLFADRSNAMCRRYAALNWDGNAEFVNAFSRPWSPLISKGSVLYAHPPYALIPRVLQRVLQEQIEMVLVTPVWPAQVWWPLLLALADGLPVLLPDSEHALLPPGFPVSKLLWPRRWRMVAWRISASTSKHWVCPAPKVTDSSTRPNTNARQRRTACGGESSYVGRATTDASIMYAIRQGLTRFA